MPRSIQALASHGIALVSALVLLGTAGSSQTGTAAELRRASGPPQRASLRLATGELVRSRRSPDSLRAAGLAVCWANTDFAGFYAPCGAGPTDEWLDWGIVSASTGSRIVGAIQFGYGTSALDPSLGGPGAALTMRFYDGAVGGGMDGGLAADAVFHLTGLPGSPDGINPVWWVLDLDLTGGSEFLAAGGALGFSLTGDDDDTAGHSRTGPLLCQAGDGAGGPDANGQVDFFDIWLPDTLGTYDGTWNFGGAPYDFASWYMAIFTADASAGPFATSVIRNDSGDTNPRVYACTPPVLGDRFTGSATRGPHLAVLFAGYAASLELVAPAGVILVDFDDPGGEMLATPTSYSEPATFDLAVPIDLTFCGWWIYTQALCFGNGASLTNACDAQLGF